MPELNLDELERLAKAATPGPWEMVDARAFLDYEDYEIRNGGHCIGYGTGEKDAAYIVAACNAVPELIAENRELQEKVRELERQRDWLVQYYSKVESPLPCPYLEGAFDQKKPCPCWVSDSGEMPEENSLEAWKKLLLAPVEYGDEYLDCGTSLNVCLKFAAEEASKEAEK